MPRGRQAASNRAGTGTGLFDHPTGISAWWGVARLKDAVDPDSARLELVDVVYRSLEPAHVSLWIRPG